MVQDAKRYRIDQWHIVDSGCQPPKKYYIREIIDVGSHEHTSSTLNSQQRRGIIAELGIDQMTDILDSCFKGTGKDPAEYNAAKCAALAVFLLDMDAARAKPLKKPKNYSA